MKEKGLSRVETVVVLTLIGIISGWLSIGFSRIQEAKEVHTKMVISGDDFFSIKTGWRTILYAEDGSKCVLDGSYGDSSLFKGKQVECAWAFPEAAK